MSRISKERYYMNIAREVASRGTCFRAKHGAVIIKEDQIISTGYVGAPRKTKDCLERQSCLRQELGIPSGQRYEMCRSVHSEQNAIINAARAGANLFGSTMYLYSEKLDTEGTGTVINAYPCFICKKMIVNAGITTLMAQQIDGSVKEYSVEDWITDWQENDLIDDMEQYGSKVVKEKVDNQ